MSLEAAFAEVLAPVVAEVRALREQVEQLTEQVSLREHGLTRPVYDVHGLRELSYSEHESYAILRSHGFKRNGRLRITDHALRRYQSGLPREGESHLNLLPPRVQKKTERPIKTLRGS